MSTGDILRKVKPLGSVAVPCVCSALAPYVCRGKGQADTRKKKLHIAEEQVVQLELFGRVHLQTAGYMAGDSQAVGHFHISTEYSRDSSWVKPFSCMGRKTLINGECN